MLLLEFARLMPQKTLAVSRRLALGPFFLRGDCSLNPGDSRAGRRANFHANLAGCNDHRAAPRVHLARQARGQQVPPYFLSYSVSDASAVSIRAQFGALVDSSANHVRIADVQVRLGGPGLDNTHGEHRGSAVNSLQLPLNDDREALARSLWLATNTGYGTALDNYLRVKTEAQVRAKEEDTSPDFSQEAPQSYIGKPAPALTVDRAAWERRMRELSKIFREFPDVYQNIVMMTAQNETDYFASSEGSRVVTPHMQARIVVIAVTKADDGMDLFREQTFEAETAEACQRSQFWKQRCANWARVLKRYARPL